MKQRNLSLSVAPGAESNVTANTFFTSEIATATVFLDYFGLLSPNQKRKFQYLWELLKVGRPINNMLEKRQDSNKVDYVWLELGLGRGKAEFKVVLLSDAMFDFFVKYQNAEVSVRFTLQELIKEAQTLEGSIQPASQD